MTSPRMNFSAVGLVVAACFALYVVCSIVPNMLSSLSPAEIYALTQSGGEIENPYRNVGLIALGLALLTGGLLAKASTSIYSKIEYVFILAIFIYNIAVTAITTPETAITQALYLTATLTFYILFQRFWLLPLEIRRMAYLAFTITIYAILAWICLFGIVLQTRWIGALHPNHAARFAVCAAFVSSLAFGRLSVIAVFFSYVVTILVTSRTAIIGLTVFVLFYLLIRSPLRFGITVAALVIGSASLAIVDYSLMDASITDSVISGLYLNDPSRGLNSGLSGRSETYANFWLRPDWEIATGSGFRSEEMRSIPLHSGMMKNFYDWGIVGGVLLYLCIMAKAFGLLARGRFQSDVEATACCSFIASSLLMTFSEPDSFTVGFLGSIVYLMALARPLQFSNISKSNS